MYTVLILYVYLLKTTSALFSLLLYEIIICCGYSAVTRFVQRILIDRLYLQMVSH